MFGKSSTSFILEVPMIGQTLKYRVRTGTTRTIHVEVDTKLTGFGVENRSPPHEARRTTQGRTLPIPSQGLTLYVGQ